MLHTLHTGLAWRYKLCMGFPRGCLGVWGAPVGQPAALLIWCLELMHCCTLRSATANFQVH
jgi:hypothetical protein